jgi:hypothetical protein
VDIPTLQNSCKASVQRSLESSSAHFCGIKKVILSGEKCVVASSSFRS